MAVLKEYVCAAHGEFDAFEPVCPSGCAGRFVKREIRTAPGLKSIGTKNADAIQQQLATDFRLGDLSNANGDSVITNLRKKDWKALKGQPPSQWVGGVPHAQEGWTQREGEKAPTFDPTSVGMGRGVALKSGSVPKPRAVIVKDSKGRPMSYNAPLPEV